MFSIFDSLFDKFLMKSDKKKIEHQCQNVRGNKKCSIIMNITNYDNRNAEEYYKRENEKQRKEEKFKIMLDYYKKFMKFLVDKRNCGYDDKTYEMQQGNKKISNLTDTKTFAFDGINIDFVFYYYNFGKEIVLREIKIDNIILQKLLNIELKFFYKGNRDFVKSLNQSFIIETQKDTYKDDDNIEELKQQLPKILTDDVFDFENCCLK